MSSGEKVERSKEETHVLTVVASDANEFVQRHGEGNRGGRRGEKEKESWVCCRVLRRKA